MMFFDIFVKIRGVQVASDGVANSVNESVVLDAGEVVVVPESARETFAEHCLSITNPILQDGMLQCQMRLSRLEGFPALDVTYDPSLKRASVSFSTTDFLESLRDRTDDFHLIDMIRGNDFPMVKNLEALEAKCEELASVQDLHRV